MASNPHIVVNSTPLIALGNTGRIELLRGLFGKVIVPEAVYREVTPKSDEAARYLKGSPLWMRIEEAPENDRVGLLPARLHAGEAEVVLLACSLKNGVVVLDDGAARKAAASLGPRVTGTLGVLIAAKRRGLIDSLTACIDQLREAVGFRLSGEVRREALRRAGEA